LPDGRTITYSYDTLNRLATLANSWAGSFGAERRKRSYCGEKELCARRAGGGAETGDGGGFIVERGDGLCKAREFENFTDVATRMKELHGAAKILKGDVGADQSAEAGTVQLRDAGEVDEDFFGFLMNEILEAIVQGIVVTADGNAAIEIQNGDVAGAAGGNFQTHGISPGENGAENAAPQPRGPVGELYAWEW